MVPSGQIPAQYILPDKNVSIITSKKPAEASPAAIKNFNNEGANCSQVMVLINPDGIEFAGTINNMPVRIRIITEIPILINLSQENLCMSDFNPVNFQLIKCRYTQFHFAGNHDVSDIFGVASEYFCGGSIGSNNISRYDHLFHCHHIGC